MKASHQDPRQAAALRPAFIWRLAAVLLAGGTLGGCVAAAIPVLASGVLTSKAVNKSDDGPGDRAGKDSGPPDRADSAGIVHLPVPAPAAPGPGPSLATNRTEEFVQMALFAVENRDNGRSVIPEPAGGENEPLLRGCTTGHPAILVDLDPGDIAFRPGDGTPVAAPGLATALATARSQGLTVLWTSVLDENRAGDVRNALAASGLDRAGHDPLLLTRDPAETKTDRRNNAAGDWCIKAIVGDRKGDFDALMDYLRDPAATTPFDELFGNGWFELPPPIAYAG